MVRNYNRLAIAAALATGLLSAQPARAEPAANTSAVVAANNAFYAALNDRNPATMAKIYAHETYVANIGPRSVAPAVGWAAVEKWAQSLSVNFKQLTVTLSDVHVHVSGDTAWVIAMEHAVGTLNDGTAIDWNLISTNVYENDAGGYEKEGHGWLMVSHQSQLVDGGLSRLSASESQLVGVVN